MLFEELGRAGAMSKFHMGHAVYPYIVLCPFVLSAAVSIALTGLVGWHAFLIWQGQVQGQYTSALCSLLHHHCWTRLGVVWTPLALVTSGEHNVIHLVSALLHHVFCMQRHVCAVTYGRHCLIVLVSSRHMKATPIVQSWTAEHN